MLKMKAIFLGLAFLVFIVCSFFAGRAGAQQLGQLQLPQRANPQERAANYTFPRAWGELKTATSTARGITYVFVADNGTVRVVQSGPVGPEDIEVISR